MSAPRPIGVWTDEKGTFAVMIHGRADPSSKSRMDDLVDEPQMPTTERESLANVGGDI